MNKMYKYYLYYFNDELYAYTDNKEYAKEFEKIRDMKKFIRIKREITREDVNILAGEEQGKYLVSQTFTIYDEERMSWFESEFIITQLERTGINNIAVQVMNEDLYKYCWDSPPSIVNDKIINALKKYSQISIIFSAKENEWESF